MVVIVQSLARVRSLAILSVSAVLLLAACSSVMPSISGMFPKSQWWERTPIIAAAWNAASGWCPGS